MNLFVITLCIMLDKDLFLLRKDDDAVDV